MPAPEEVKPSAEEAQAEAAPAVPQAAEPESVSEAVQEAAPAVVPQDAAGQGEAEQQEQEQLFQHLAALRRQIASEVRLPPYIIFHVKIQGSGIYHDISKP